ncbi:regulatory protein RecX [Haliovirga abyssi]|uniref:Regulatory protein RecX n=1 Tax=Haliovirga abyssi TaxID=2996794 RepID=A0AAU9D7F5_9FUSO|nr:regulatory protein RecX [Haliovirga abyssi]BDU49506.1 hypothetical protein HLVA_00750 [Haliovirga abyssi]
MNCLKITKIIKNKVYFTNEEKEEILNLNKYLLYKYKIVIGKEISIEDFDKMVEELIREKAIYLLSRRDYSEKELKLKLKEKYNYSEKIDKVMSVLLERGYIDNFRYAVNFIENKKFGYIRMKYELNLKGISEDMISKIYEISDFDEKEFLKYHLKKVKNRDREKKIAYLMRRGFKFEDITKMIGRDEDEYSDSI